MKRFVCIFVSVLEIALLTGAFVVNFYTRSKMGMMRYVIYINQSWEREYPIVALKMSLIAVLSILTVLIFLWLVKKRRYADKCSVGMVIVMLALTAGYAWFTLLCSTETHRAYYFISMMLGLAAFLQIVKTFVGIKWKVYRKNL